MEELVLTEEERRLIITRRRLAIERKKRANQAPKNEAKVPEKKKDAVLGENRPKDWDSHCSPCTPHQGRMTEAHPLYWFEKEVFRKISNMQHKEQHKKIAKLLKLPVQNVFRDRQYHALAHMEALWQQQMLPLKYKIRYEKYKEEHGIGPDLVHPEHKKLKPDYNYPVAKLERPWDAEKYGPADEKEEFEAGKKYIYDYDKEIGYEYKE